MALDAIDCKVWTQSPMYMRHVDAYRDRFVSAFCTAGRRSTRRSRRAPARPVQGRARARANPPRPATPRHNPTDTKFLLMHDQKTDDNSMKTFFAELYELYVKVLLNPFYEKNSPILSPEFRARVKHISRRLT